MTHIVNTAVAVKAGMISLINHHASRCTPVINKHIKIPTKQAIPYFYLPKIFHVSPTILLACTQWSVNKKLHSLNSPMLIFGSFRQVPQTNMALLHSSLRSSG